MRLSDYLEPDLVLLDLRTEGVEDTLEAVVERLRQAGSVVDPAAVVRALAERESSHSTSLGNGVALPHATVSGMDRPVVVVAVAPAGVPFGRDAEEPVRLFFVLLSPLTEAGTHIKLLARIVRLVRRPGFVAALLEAGSGEALVNAVERLDALHV
ncbi:MAG TPA: PTS sugar transporter subunit IIA [Longimicrobiales bacterium]|nr:PTS sugar transporter subunit IIA [Longimicrobiales bacterium]